LDDINLHEKENLFNFDLVAGVLKWRVGSAEMPAAASERCDLHSDTARTHA
jgi:hypothetical protein